ncbi:MAG: putative baseplate assembly protein [Actinobacteria bacterium]|nr:MAG: putative baseplate assembly protein [Actinomycetota bacterium]
MAAQYRCGDARRRRAVRDASPATINGIDYLEVLPGQTALEVVFLHNLPGESGGVPGSPTLTTEHVVVDGGVRIRGIAVTKVEAAGNVLTVTVNAPGDFSTYLLRLRTSSTDETPPAGFDPQLAEVPFSFKVECPNDFDCAVPDVCPPEVLPEPEIDYLAKDYESFRRLMLDRMATVAPDWTERHPADAHVALVELLAYVGDHLSYFQDAVATEAYLGTARKRVSVRRHARLLDYRVHSGSNARAWVVFEVDPGGGADGTQLNAGRRILSRGPVEETIVKPTELEKRLAAERPVVFETMETTTLRAAHNAISFYTWSDEECCLPAGATRATLVDDPALDLGAGDAVLFEEVRSPTTGAAADADPTRRHAVRLVSAEHAVDALDGTKVLEIAWSSADALPFPLCVSALVAPAGGTAGLAEIALAHGNVALADHGLSIPVEPLVPHVSPAGRPYRPHLAQGPLTFRAAFDPAGPAAHATRTDPREALPVVAVTGEGETWGPQFDLLRSDRFATEFVVEVESDGIAHLRFGDDERGRRPQEGSEFDAAYRVGNGLAGNVGPEALTRVAVGFAGIRGVRNPLAATGGTEPEPLERARLDSPEAFRTQERAVTEADYAEVTGRHAEVQRAAAAFRWTGSWYTTFVTVDRAAGREIDVAFSTDLRTFLDRYRMAGHDLELEGPVTVPLDLLLEVCVRQGYFRSDVEEALLDRLSDRVLSGGSRGFFHPDNFTFGQPVYLSQIYETAMDVAGVEWVLATRFQRFGKVAGNELDEEVLRPAPREVARLDNDPNFPENGRLELAMKGGM